MAMVDPANAHASSSKEPWRPTRYLESSQPPQDEVIKAEEYEIAVKVAEQWGGGVDFAGRAPKLLKPRRTVDYMAGMGRMKTVSSWGKGPMDIKGGYELSKNVFSAI
jgi:hypothetical protein